MSTYLPTPYRTFQQNHPEVAEALETLGTTCHEAGPLPPEIRHLIKLGAATANQSEGGVKSHVRQALEAGATPEQIRHALLLCLTTAGFPGMIAALGWASEVFEARGEP
jgi:AhpD family alkylhydroperoxidase